eukprot:2728056-Amphidinium_carterae.1
MDANAIIAYVTFGSQIFLRKQTFGSKGRKRELENVQACPRAQFPVYSSPSYVCWKVQNIATRDLSVLYSYRGGPSSRNAQGKKRAALSHKDCLTDESSSKSTFNKIGVQACKVSVI